MNEPKKCLVCGSLDTERVHTEWFQYEIEEVRICNDCPSQYTNRYNLFEQVTDHTEAD